MSTSATAQLPMSVLDDDAWDDLLSFIEERRVIPIIGPELLQVAALIDSVPPQMRALRSIQLWRNRVHEAMRGSTTRLAPAAAFRGVG